MKLKVSIKSALTEREKSQRRKMGLGDEQDEEEEKPGEQAKPLRGSTKKKEKKKRGEGESLLPPLRDFKEGRYEDLLVEFDKRRARKEGVAVEKPDKTEKKRQERKKIRKAVRHMEKRGVFDQK
jgi:hypothetical protein